MTILEELRRRNEGNHQPFLIGPGGSLAFDDIAAAKTAGDLVEINQGDVVALVGDFDGPTIATMLELLDRGAMLMPLTDGTRADHEYFFESGPGGVGDSTGIALERLAPPTGSITR